MDWTTVWAMVGAISTAIMACVILATGIIAFMQLRALRRQQALVAFERLMAELGSEEARRDRGLIHDKIAKTTPLSEWDEDVINAADRTAVRLDRTGFLLLNGLAHKEEIIGWLAEMISSMWDNLEPYVLECRKQEGRRNHGHYFERLARDAKKTLV
ncbi:MAG: hypothetical protein HW388_1676 [Dehalococcoidia bacterium]|nr:hypothetical protein [Dehalococcoidia bacterium]